MSSFAYLILHQLWVTAFSSWVCVYITVCIFDLLINQFILHLHSVQSEAVFQWHSLSGDRTFSLSLYYANGSLQMTPAGAQSGGTAALTVRGERLSTWRRCLSESVRALRRAAAPRGLLQELLRLQQWSSMSLTAAASSHHLNALCTHIPEDRVCMCVCVVSVCSQICVCVCVFIELPLTIDHLAGLCPSYRKGLSDHL